MRIYGELLKDISNGSLASNGIMLFESSILFFRNKSKVYNDKLYSPIGKSCMDQYEDFDENDTLVWYRVHRFRGNVTYQLMMVDMDLLTDDEMARLERCREIIRETGNE